MTSGFMYVCTLLASLFRNSCSRLTRSALLPDTVSDLSFNASFSSVTFKVLRSSGSCLPIEMHRNHSVEVLYVMWMSASSSMRPCATMAPDSTDFFIWCEHLQMEINRYVLAYGARRRPVSAVCRYHEAGCVGGLVGLGV